MSNNISIYKTIDNSIYKNLKINQNDIKFSYVNNKEEIPILLEDQNDLYSFYMGKSDSYWDVNNDDLKIERTFTIENPKAFFGENGITTDEGELDIGVHIHSRGSNFQTTVPLNYTITSKDETCEIIFKYTLEGGEAKGDIYFDVFVYLKNKIKKVSRFADLPGIKLGEIDNFKIIVDGDGSIFPIVEVERPGQPLWNLAADWTDINSDSFDTENVRIEINNKHHMYNYIYNSTKPSQYLLLEILSNAIAQIIFKVSADPDFDIDGEMIPDNIATVVVYWIQTFEVDISNFENINYSLRRNMESLFI